MALSDYLETTPEASVEDDDLGFIGMPKGYVPMSPGMTYAGGPMGINQIERRSQPKITPPRYKVGSEMEPRSYSPEMIARLQQQLAAAGLITPDSRFRLGIWDSVSINAYKKLLGFANQGGTSREDALQTLLTNPALKPGEMGGGIGGDAPQGRMQTYEASDPAGVRQTAEAAFRQALGRKPNKTELETFTASFLGKERGSQDVVFAAQDRLDARNQAAADAAAGGAPASGGEEGGSESDILWNRLQQMVADSPYEIQLGSRSRSYEKQVELWNNSPAMGGNGPVAAKPGTSKHGDGRANDLKYVGGDKARAWALANAHKYGLHFPIYDPKKPRRVDESWHVELKDGHSVGDGHNHGAAPGAAMNESVTVQRQDVGAQALEYARTVNPDETAAYDIGGQFNSLLAILQKGVV